MTLLVFDMLDQTEKAYNLALLDASMSPPLLLHWRIEQIRLAGDSDGWAGAYKWPPDA